MRNSASTGGVLGTRFRRSPTQGRLPNSISLRSPRGPPDRCRGSGTRRVADRSTRLHRTPALIRGVKLSVVMPAHNEADGSSATRSAPSPRCLPPRASTTRSSWSTTAQHRRDRSRSSPRSPRTTMPRAPSSENDAGRRLRPRRARRPGRLHGRRRGDRDGRRLGRPARRRRSTTACSRPATTARSARASCRARRSSTTRGSSSLLNRLVNTSSGCCSATATTTRPTPSRPTGAR